MQSVLEVSKRRENHKQPLPGFPGNYLLNENNSSNVSSNNIDPFFHDIHNYPEQSRRKLDKRNTGPWSPLAPVLAVEKKRATTRSNPPGLHYYTANDCNNNSKKKAAVKRDTPAKGDNSVETKSKGREDKITKKREKYGVAKSKNVPEANNTKEDNSDVKSNNVTVKKNPMIECITALKGNDSAPYLAKLTPDCLRGKVSDIALPKVTTLKKLIKPKRNKQELIKADIITVEIAGETIHVNILPQREEDQESSLFLDDRLSPENYDQTYLFYDHEILRRRDVRRASQVLGYLLIDEEVDGEREEWIAYTEKCAEEEMKWRAKCRKSHDYFEKTKTIIAKETPESFYTRAVRYLKEAGQIIKKACPCVLNGT